MTVFLAYNHFCRSFSRGNEEIYNKISWREWWNVFDYIWKWIQRLILQFISGVLNLTVGIVTNLVLPESVHVDFKTFNVATHSAVSEVKMIVK